MLTTLKGGLSRTGAIMQRVDGNYLYQIGSQIHPLSELRYQQMYGGPATTLEQARYPVYIAESAVDQIINRSIFRLRTSLQPGNNLLIAIRSLKEKIEQAQDTNQTLNFLDVYTITSALTAFEAVLGAELGLLPLYLVLQQGGFDMTVMIELGAKCFPIEVVNKVPEAVPDLEQGTRCIAFALPTAAGFHLHRANESVLRRYWDAVTKGAPHPGNKTMGDYLAEMDKQGIGDARVRAALRDLKNLHRNPLIHPEHSLDSVDDAIALMNGIHTVMVHMLKGIPIVVPALPAGAAAPPAVLPPSPTSPPTASLP